MKTFGFAFLIVLAISTTASADNGIRAYAFDPIRWDGHDIADGLPMVCDDAYFNAVTITAPGLKNRDFLVSIEGDEGCSLDEIRYNPTRNESKLLIRNEGRCVINVVQVEDVKGTPKNTATYELSDAC